MKDLLIIVADEDAYQLFKACEKRFEALGTRPFTFEICKHSQRDSGVRTHGVELVRTLHRNFEHILLTLDYEGAGASVSAQQLAEDITRQLTIATGGKGCLAVVFDPEIENLLWGSDDVLREILEWEEPKRIRDEIRASGFKISPANKPERPKEALQALLKRQRKALSASYYYIVASRISLQNCQDAEFKRLREKLQEWFPPE